jgi:hypothetical protein
MPDAIIADFLAVQSNIFCSPRSTITREAPFSTVRDALAIFASQYATVMIAGAGLQAAWIRCVIVNMIGYLTV